MENWPKDLEVNPIIAKVYKHRYETIKAGSGIDYGAGEALAFASLMKEGTLLYFVQNKSLIIGYGVKLNGQDVERGTFSHRHLKIND